MMVRKSRFILILFISENRKNIKCKVSTARKVELLAYMYDL